MCPQWHRRKAKHGAPSSVDFIFFNRLPFFLVCHTVSAIYHFFMSVNGEFGTPYEHSGRA